MLRGSKDETESPKNAHTQTYPHTNSNTFIPTAITEKRGRPS